MVEAAWFHDAHARACARLDTSGSGVTVKGQGYRLLAHIGAGSISDVFLAERIAPLPERVTLKLVRAAADAPMIAREADVLARLQALDTPTAAYYSQRLPRVIASGMANTARGRATNGTALVLRHPAGYWGSLADVRRNYPAGIDARHAVWIWRRLLDILGFVHGAGWTHGDIHPEHLLVHPRNHGILLIGWAAARDNGGRSAIGHDLRQAAWAIRMLLGQAGKENGDEHAPAIPASVPPPLATLLRATSEDVACCDGLDAAGLDRELVQAAASAFGPPKFIDFHPHPRAE